MSGALIMLGDLQRRLLHWERGMDSLLMKRCISELSQSGVLATNVERNNALLVRLKQGGSVKPDDGGEYDDDDDA